VPGLSTKETTADSAGHCSHQATIALLARSRIGGAILAILILLVSVGVVGVLRWGVLVVGSLLRELMRRIARWVLSAATTISMLFSTSRLIEPRRITDYACCWGGAGPPY